MIIQTQSLTLETLPERLVVCYPSNHPLLSALEQHLDVAFESLVEDDLTLLTPMHHPTLKRLYVAKKSALETLKKRQSVAASVAKSTQPIAVAIDTFDEEKGRFYEALSLAHYRFDVVKGNSFKPLTPITLFTDDETSLKEARVIAEAINLTKTLVNTPYSHLNALDLAELASSYADYPHTTVEILDKEAIEKLSMGAFLAVNKGSLIPPRLIHIKYRHGGDKPLTTIIGKGVMYDTGGYSLKPSTSMPTMKMDMGGAANVMGVMKALAHLEVPVNVDGLILATDNRIGDHAIVPDDIVTAADGTTIEIVSTDAEGRLTLADALWYAQEQGASKLLDMATLTGAVVAALGKSHIGAFTNNEDYLKTFLVSAEKAEEKFWWLPQGEEHKEGLKSHVADLKNSGPRVAGASVAAAFLNHFVKPEIPWIHLDVAGVTYEEKKGATGRVVKAVLQHLIDNA